MANVLNKSTLELRSSVNTPDYPESDWLINPDLSAVAGLDPRYWKIAKNAVAAMTAGERQAVDDALAADAKEALAAAAKEDAAQPLLKAVASMLADELTLLRKELSLPDRTDEQIAVALTAKIDAVVQSQVEARG